MENHSQKRKEEMSDELPAEKRVCSDNEDHPNSSTRDYVVEPSNTSSSSHSDRDSVVSGGSDDDERNHYQSRERAGPESKFTRIFSELSFDGACPSRTLVALTELCDILLLCSEDTLSSFSWVSYVKTLVNLSQNVDSPDIMLLSIRAMTYLCDIVPRSAVFLVNADAIPALVAPLLCIEYLDVAEQCLQVLEKISRHQPKACLEAGCIMAALSYINFFSLNIQKVAISLVANVCGKLPSDSSSFDFDAIPALCNLLQYDDKKLVETSALCLVKIVETLSSQKMNEGCFHSLIQHSVHLIALRDRMLLSESTYSGLIGMLAKLASTSTVTIKMLYELNVGAALKSVLLFSQIATVSRYTDHGEPASSQVHKSLKLLNVLLPPLDQSCDNEALSDDWEEILGDHRQRLLDFGNEILPTLIQVVSSAASTCVCYGCLNVIHRIVAFTNVDSLVTVLEGANISSFLANVFTMKDRHILISGLKTAKLLLHKLPELYVSFVKEGVLFAIGALQDPEKSSQVNHYESASSHILLVSNQKVDAVATDVRDCFCHAFDVHRPTSTEFTTCEIKDLTVQAVAEHIMNTYITAMANNTSCSASECIERLRSFSTSLASSAHLVDTSSISRQRDVLHHLVEVINDRKEAVSTFELVKSGIVRSVVDYLSSGTLGEETMDDLALLRRFALFVSVSLISTDEHSRGVHLASLVRKLQSALSSMERFPVITTHAPKLKTVYSNIPYPHYTRHPCLKIKFIRKEGEGGLRDFSQEIQSVEAFLKVDDLDKFLWTKVCGSDVNEVSANDGETPIDERQADSSIRGPSDSGDATRKNIVKMRLAFYLDGKPLSSSLTLWQSIMQHFMTDDDAPITSRFWTEVYTVTYGNAEASKRNGSTEILSVHGSVSSVQKSPLLIQLLLADVPWNLNLSNSSTRDILLLLKKLEVMNKCAFSLMSREKNHAFAEGRLNNFDELTVTISTIPQMNFVNCKLSDKLEQQMQDPLAMSTAGMPSWCIHLVTSFPFLFSFESRRKYFRLDLLNLTQTSLQNRRNYSGSGSSRERLDQSLSPPRAKFQVSRQDILGSASKMITKYARCDEILEVEFIDEVGSGLGPTLEFYTLVSHEFQRVGLDLWRDDYSPSADGGSDFVAAPFGLFPRPWSCSVKDAKFSKVISKFVLLGEMVAKALHDGRVMDLPLAKAFYKLVVGQELDIYDITTFDPRLGRSLIEFQALASRKKLMNASTSGDSAYEHDLCFRGSRVEDLGLNFTLPGYSDYELAHGPDYVVVNIDNLGEYVSLVVDATVKSGISRQLEAFKLGFKQVLPLCSLKIFTEDEFDQLLCGEKAYWNSEDLREHLKFDHGYTLSSSPVLFLLEILDKFEVNEQRAFLQFVTGTPRLPLGGLAALNPKLTIVRKNGSNFVDGDLPSAMTCVNYLKLPPYSAKEIMLERLLYAISEGQGSFHLS